MLWASSAFYQLLQQIVDSGPKEIIDYGKGGALVPIKIIAYQKKFYFCLNNYEISIKKSKYAKKD